MPESSHLTTAEAARRLGVKTETLYAYVSRGLLRSKRNANGRGSLFDRAEVEALAAAGRRATQAAPTVAIHTGITLIDGERVYYRGHDVSDLAARPYESVANLLWTGRLDPIDLTSPPEMRKLAEAVTAPLPATARLIDRLRVIVAAAAAADPLRFDTSPAAVVGCGRSLIATMVDALPLKSRRRDTGQEATTVAERLWPRLTAAPLASEKIAALNAALVLVADHDLAASTMAARVAASTRANPYAVVSAGLAALDGPLHGLASTMAHEVIADALAARDPVQVISDRLRAGSRIPGFGHRIYAGGDPRAKVLMAMLPNAPGRVGAAIDAVETAVTARSHLHPNLDFGIATLTTLNGMDADAGEAIFAIGRAAGWLAHALEEYADRPMRFRPVGRYDGPPPLGDL
jgi:citrate synthase